MRAEDSEILSVVDNQDQFIGQRRRDDIHRLSLPHRAIHVLVFRLDGRLFLQKRGLHKQESPGLWDSSVAGHVDADETYDACCVREIEEEIGIRMEEMPKRLFKLVASPQTGMEFCWVYRLVTDLELALDYTEMETGQWFAQAQVDQWLRDSAEDFAESFRTIWHRFSQCKEVDVVEYV
jgi:isopentenyl-diphosphate delta-isomerase type 1